MMRGGGCRGGGWSQTTLPGWASLGKVDRDQVVKKVFLYHGSIFPVEAAARRPRGAKGITFVRWITDVDFELG